MMNLIDRLRKAADDRDGWDVSGLLREAADVLQAQQDRLREILRELSALDQLLDEPESGGQPCNA